MNRDMKKFIYSVFIFVLTFMPIKYVFAADIDSNGFLTHTVEINLPPGTAGLAPSLSLSYNSGAGNGIVGKGWNLNGIPVIERDPSRWIKYDDNDTYRGYSGRLILQSGDSFHFEYENYSEIRRIGSDDNPKYWIETRNDGTKYYYGNYGDASDANVKAAGKGGAVRTWALSKVEDTHGNYYTIEYDQEFGEFYPARIIYTRGNGISVYRVVEFIYEDRDDFTESYEYSAKVLTTKRLAGIKVIIDVPSIFRYPLTVFGKTVRSYVLKYKSNSDISRLEQVSVYSSNSKLLDYQKFTWESQITDYSWWYVDRTIEENCKLIAGDFNGDGYDDIALSDDQNNTLVMGYSNDKGFVFPDNSLTNHLNNPNLITGDFNGDGRIDMASCSGWFIDQVFMLYSSGDGFVPDNFDNTIGYSDTFASADLNGDGLDDICWSDWADNKLHIKLSNGNGFDKENDIKHITIKQDDILITGDFNGDGLKDVCWSDHDDDVVVTGYSTGSDLEYSYKHKTVLDKNIDVNDTIMTGDFNGDGKTDICYSDWEDNAIHILISTGDSTDEQCYDWKYVEKRVTKEQKLLTGDFNGDGRSDLAYSDYDKDRIYIGYIKYSINGTISIDWEEYSKGINDDHDIDDNDLRIVGDFNGDGISEIVYSDYEDGRISKFSIEKKPDCINRITTYTGTAIDVTYQKAASLVGVIVPDNSVFPEKSDYPNIPNSYARYLVKSIKVTNDRNESFLTNYEYKNGRFLTGLRDERENLYFKTITAENVATGITTVTTYNQIKYLGGYPQKTVIKNNSTTLRVDNFQYNCGLTSEYKTKYVNLKSKSSVVYEAGSPFITQSKSYTYDSCGNVTYLVEHTDGLDDIITDTTYDATFTSRPSRVTKTSGGKILQDTQYTYTPKGGIETVSAYNDDGWVTTTYGEDDCGNITSVTDAENSTTTMTYDGDYNAFIETVTNPMGQTVEMEYDPATGNVTAKTDPNGNRVTTAYDEQGRVISVTDATGKTVKDIEYGDTPGNRYIQVKLLNDTGYSTEKSFLDSFGREWRRETTVSAIGSENLKQVKLTNYNAKGQVTNETLPYIEGVQSPMYITYTYDTQGRVKTATRPISETGSKTESTQYRTEGYNILVTKTDIAGRVSSALVDPSGKIKTKTEPGGAVIQYSYDPAGRLTGVTDAGGSKTHITYDILGRKTSIDDPNTGVTSYEYDDLGRLKVKTDSGGNAIVYQYDRLGRVIKTDYPEGTEDVEYVYDETSFANAKGRLTTVKNGVTETHYGYDQNGNPDYMRQTVDNMDFIFTMVYDRQGKMTMLQYPDGDTVSMDYSQAGYLQAVKKSEDAAYVQYGLEPHSESASRYRVKRVTGDGLTTYITYNPATLQPGRVVTQNSAGETVENNKYEYDLAGNITEIKDNVDTARSQSFEYDSLNRLVKAKGIYGRHDYTYSTSGNLTTNNYGILEYKDTTHPNAVTKDGRDNIYVYDARGNMVIRGEQSLKYDAENRLTEISRNNTAIQQNSYDHTGHRVLKKLPDGTHVYNINGLYELGQKAGYADTHTKYIYGMKGDIAAQVTKESSKVKKRRFYSGTLYDGRYHSNGAVRLASTVIIAVNEFTDTPGNIWKVERWVIGTLALSMILLLLYSSKKRGITILRLPQWTEAISMLLVISLVTSMTLTGCTGGDIPGVSDDTEDTENTVTDSTGAIPAKGLYYFHPDHVGSISYLTDSTGKIVSKMNYTPYGEVIKSKSTGTEYFNRKYTGQTYDASTTKCEMDNGLYYYNARYYDPGIGRFITADTLVPNPYNSQSYNRYMYVFGNPIRYNDPSGHVGEHPEDAVNNLDNVIGNPRPDGISGNQGNGTGNGNDSIDTSSIDTNTNPGIEHSKPDGEQTDFGYEGGDHGGSAGNRGYGHSQNYDLSLYSSFNLDWGLDFKTAAYAAYRNKDYFNAGLFAVDSFCEFSYDSLLAASGIYGIGLLARFVSGVVAGGGAAAVGRNNGNISNQLGQAGESAVRSVYNIGDKVSIRIAGRTRIPDGLTRTTLSEVKNVQSLSLTSQLRDFLTYSQTRGLTFDLYTRPDTVFSGPLNELINNGIINQINIPGY